MEQLSKHQKADALFELIASITNPADCKALFQDLCTAKEIENMAERVYAATGIKCGMCCYGDYF